MKVITRSCKLFLVILSLPFLAACGSLAQSTAQDSSSVADLYFGDAVSIAGNAAIVGSPYGVDGRSPGLVYVFDRVADGWSQTATLSATGGKWGNQFGSAVALVEGTALVGAWGTHGVAPVSGSAFVFESRPSGWRQVAALINPDARESDLLGYSVALDAGTAVVGAPGVNRKLPDDTSKTAPAWSGAVYIWTKNESGWIYQGKVTPDSVNSASNPSAQPGPYHLFDSFGRTVAIDGDILVVGAQNETTTAGKVYVFRRHNDMWRQEAELKQQQDSFGIAVGVSGGIVAVASSKSVFIFERINDNWQLQAKVEPHLDGEESGFQYGGPVSIDGNLMAVGAARYKNRKGAAYVFEHIENSWTQVAIITGQDTRPDYPFSNRVGDLFGGSIALHGNTILAGASFHDSEGQNFGAAYVFGREGRRWTQTAKLVAQVATGTGSKGQ